MVSHGESPLDTASRPVAHHLEAALASCCAERGEGETPRVQRDQGELETFTLSPEQILTWDPDVRETKGSVRKRTKSHEGAFFEDLDSVPLGFDDEGGDRLAFRPFRRWRARHDDDDVGAWTVCGPELFAVENPV